MAIREPKMEAVLLDALQTLGLNVTLLQLYAVHEMNLSKDSEMHRAQALNRVAAAILPLDELHDVALEEQRRYKVRDVQREAARWVPKLALFEAERHAIENVDPYQVPNLAAEQEQAMRELVYWFEHTEDSDPRKNCEGLMYFEQAVDSNEYVCDLCDTHIDEWAVLPEDRANTQVHVGLSFPHRPLYGVPLNKFRPGASWLVGAPQKQSKWSIHRRR